MHNLRRWGGAALGITMVTSVLGGGSAGAVAGANPISDGTYSFNAKITFGQVHACSGALIERSWVVTAKSCFAEGNAPVVAGPPTQPTTVVVGRADLTEATGYEVSAVSVIPHPDRNLALVQLPVPVSEEVPAIPIATSPAVPRDAQDLGVRPNRDGVGTEPVARRIIHRAGCRTFTNRCCGCHRWRDDLQG